MRMSSARKAVMCLSLIEEIADIMLQISCMEFACVSICGMTGKLAKVESLYTFMAVPRRYTAPRDKKNSFIFVLLSAYCIFAVTAKIYRIRLQAALLGEAKGNDAKAHSSGGDEPHLRRKQR